MRDDLYDFGPRLGVMRMYSIEHLRCQNIRRNTPAADLLDILRKKKYIRFPLSKILAARLERLPDLDSNDHSLIAAIIRDGHARGLRHVQS